MKRYVGVVAGLLGLWACWGAEPHAEPASTRDSAGVRITTTNLGDRARVPTCPVDPSAFIDLGEAEGDPAFQFTEVAGVVRLADGRYVVVDRRTQEMRFFDSTGHHTRTVGRQGEGPGEFRDPIQLIRRPGDTLVIFDWDLQRLSWFAPSGDFVASVNLRPTQPDPVPDLQFVGPEPHIWMASHPFTMLPATEYVEQSLVLVRFDRSGRLIDTVATLPYGTRGWVNQAVGMAGSPLFEPRSVWTANDDHVIVATGERDEFTIWNQDGVPIQLVRWTGVDRRVTDVQLAEYRARRLARNLGTAMEALLRQRYEDTPVMEDFPAVTELMWSAGGVIWAREYSGEGIKPNSWLAFESDGRFRCRVTFDDAFQVHALEVGYVLGSRPDSLDVPHVIGYLIGAPESWE